MTGIDIDVLLEQLISIIETEYTDIVIDCEIINGKLRVYYRIIPSRILNTF